MNRAWYLAGIPERVAVITITTVINIFTARFYLIPFPSSPSERLHYNDLRGCTLPPGPAGDCWPRWPKVLKCMLSGQSPRTVLPPYPCQGGRGGGHGAGASAGQAHSRKRLPPDPPEQDLMGTFIARGAAPALPCSYLVWLLGSCSPVSALMTGFLQMKGCFVVGNPVPPLSPSRPPTNP